MAKIKLSQHISIVHEEAKPFSCVICDRRFSFDSNMKDHIKKVHEGKRFECNVCDAKYVKESRLKTHIKIVHKDKNLVRNICSAGISN